MSVLSDELKNAILDEDFYLTNDILERIKAEENGESYIHDLMEFMSENPALDYGMPGPIIHFIESYGIDKYIDTLLELENSKPNVYFNWMLNRIINVTEGELKEKYIKILQNVANRTDIEQYICDVAKEFVEYQLEN